MQVWSNHPIDGTQSTTTMISNKIGEELHGGNSLNTSHQGKRISSVDSVFWLT